MVIVHLLTGLWHQFAHNCKLALPLKMANICNLSLISIDMSEMDWNKYCLFLWFIKLLIDSIHPFSEGVDCVSKWQSPEQYLTTARGSQVSLNSIELYQN